MSQIETIMLVALGFVGALLVGMLVARGVWAYAVSLGKRRVERRAPSAIAELQADRDRLKAEYAMQGRRLQLRLDDLKTRMAEQLAETSRNRNRIEQLVSEIRKRDEQLASKDEELAAANASAEALERELTERTELVQQTKDLLLNREEETSELRSQLSIVEAQLTVRSDPLVTDDDFDTAAAGKGDSANDRLRQRIAQLNAISKQINEQRKDLNVQQEELATLREQINRSQKSDSSVLAAARSAAKTTQDDNANLTPEDAVSGMEVASSRLEQQIVEAESETDKLAQELAKLDELWSSSSDELNLSAAAGSASDGKTNITELASVRLKKHAAEQQADSEPKKKSATTKAGRTAKKAAAKTSASKSKARKKKIAKPAKPARTSRATAAKKAPAKAAKANKPVEGKPVGKTSTGRKPRKTKTPDVALPGTRPQIGALVEDTGTDTETSTQLSNSPDALDDNVISLAQRIRALQADLTGKP